MPTSRVTTRLATYADIPQLVELMQEFYAESSFPLDRAWAAEAFARLLDDPSRGAIWIVDIDETPAGHVVLSVRFAMEFGGVIGYVDDLFIRPAFRRQGAARAALDVLTAECRRRGCRAVLVEVDPGNAAAQALYRRLGLLPLDDERETLRRSLGAEV
jgi:ribosomal protein S18 acetylase RimI-like enzyme